MHQPSRCVENHEYAVLVTSLTDEVRSVAQLYRDRRVCPGFYVLAVFRDSRPGIHKYVYLYCGECAEAGSVDGIVLEGS